MIYIGSHISSSGGYEAMGKNAISLGADTFAFFTRNPRGVALQDKIGVCLDTCHIWDGGYDIVGDLDGVLQKFDDIIGIDRLCAVHLNDSKNPCGSHKDRHEKIGQGMIGAEGLRRVVQHPFLQGKPFILETPNDDEGYRQEISMIRSWMMI